MCFGFEPFDVFRGKVHPEAIPPPGRRLRCGRGGELLQYLAVQPPGSCHKGVAPGFLCGLFFQLTLFLGGRDDDRCSGSGPFCGLSLGLCLSLSRTSVLPAAVFMQCIVDAQGPQVFGNTGFSVFAAGLPDEAQFLPPGLHSLTQFLFGLGEVKGFVEPLGHKQTVKRNQRFQLPDAVPVDQPQGGCLFFPLDLFYCFYLLINGTGDPLALGLHLPDALLKVLQRVSVKPLGGGQSSS